MPHLFVFVRFVCMCDVRLLYVKSISKVCERVWFFSMHGHAQLHSLGFPQCPVCMHILIMLVASIPSAIENCVRIARFVVCVQCIVVKDCKRVPRPTLLFFLACWIRYGFSLGLLYFQAMNCGLQASEYL